VDDGGWTRLTERVRRAADGQLRDFAADVALAHNQSAESRLSSSIYRRCGAVARAEQFAGRSADLDGVSGSNADVEQRRRLDLLTGFNADVDSERNVVIQSDRIAIKWADRRTDCRANRDSDHNGVPDAGPNRDADPKHWNAVHSKVACS